MADILIAGGTVITVDAERRIIDDGAVAIAGTRIADVGPREALAAKHPSARRVDARRKVVMPGLIDCHAHAGHGLVKTMGGLEPGRWTAACERIYTAGSSADFWRAEARLAALERLKAGTTCGVSYLGGGDDIMRTDDPLYGRRHCAATGEVGIRSVLAVGPCPPPYPRTFVAWENGGRRERAVGFADQLATCAALIDEWHGADDGRVFVSLTFPVIYPETAPGGAAAAEVRAQAAEVKALCAARGVRLTQDGHAKGSIRLAHDRLGLIDEAAYLSHCVDLLDDEIALCAETGAKIVHNPSAVRSITGRCPVPELIDAGVTVAIGSDGPAPDRSLDMFRHVFQAMHYQRARFRDPTVLPPGKAIEMVTIDAARVLGLEAEIGSLEPGKRADLILVDMAKPHLYPPNMPLFRIACFATGADVDTVVVDGRVVMENRAVKTVDEGEVLDDAERECALMIERTGLAPLLAAPDRLWGRSRY